MGDDAGNLLTLQGRIKRDPQGYHDEFNLQLRHYRALLVRARAAARRAKGAAVVSVLRRTSA